MNQQMSDWTSANTKDTRPHLGELFSEDADKGIPKETKVR